jgi:hypothetical protein
VWLQVLVVGLDAVYGMELRLASTPAGQLTLKDLLEEVQEVRAQVWAAEAAAEAAAEEAAEAGVKNTPETVAWRLPKIWQEQDRPVRDI